MPEKPSPSMRHRAGESEKIYATRQLGKIAARWDARAATWDKSLRNPACHLNEDGSYARFLQEAHRVIHRQRRFCAKRGVIDVGCGTGLVLSEVVRSFAWGIGIDISKEMILRGGRKQISNARFVIGDCFKLAQLCPPAGMVLSRGILLSHYGRTQGENLLTALRAALLPRGILIIDFLNLRARSRHNHVPDSKAYFTETQVRHMALAAGFRSPTILGEMERRVLLLLAVA